jgi:hypothetical protein
MMENLPTLKEAYWLSSIWILPATKTSRAPFLGDFKRALPWQFLLQEEWIGKAHLSTTDVQSLNIFPQLNLNIWGKAQMLWKVSGNYESRAVRLRDKENVNR